MASIENIFGHWFIEIYDIFIERFCCLRCSHLILLNNIVLDFSNEYGIDCLTMLDFVSDNGDDDVENKDDDFDDDDDDDEDIDNNSNWK